MTVAEAEGWIKEADVRLSSESPSHLAAASFYEKAIQTYRTIPQKERSAHHVAERLAELHSRLSQSGEAALNEMRAVNSASLDIGEIVEKAREAVSGKTSFEALKSFCSLRAEDECEASSCECTRTSSKLYRTPNRSNNVQEPGRSCDCQAIRTGPRKHTCYRRRNQCDGPRAWSICQYSRSGCYLASASRLVGLNIGCRRLTSSVSQASHRSCPRTVADCLEKPCS